ncbi:MAG: DUF4012 domain-containing protein [Candidatus Moranbacteria bacterium]|nr:DUF4012 domain-containing protein [Candidatus Moranbacteria bacterium]
MKRPRVTVEASPSFDEYASFRAEAEGFPVKQSPHVLSSEAVTIPEQPTPASAPRRIRSKKTGRWIILLVGLCVLGAAFFFFATASKEHIVTESEEGMSALLQAVTLLQGKQYDQAADSFRQAHQSFGQAEETLSWWGGPLLDVVRFVPGLSVVASGKHAILAGKYFGEAGIPLSELVKNITVSKEAYAQGEKVSLLSFLAQAKEPLEQVRKSLTQTERELALVRIDDLPVEKREKFLLVRTSLPSLLALLSGLEKNELLIEELLGGNGPRTYLFLLQNNHEMRATGGFIGTYALVDVNQGVIRRFFVDGIFNPDGQLKENIIPPKPIQKISAGWSLHDSNWFPDFPASAEKAIFFYEKTGGPTVDGVITLTPTVMQKLLSVVGPIAMPQYGITVDADNFIPVLQEQVEVKYDKELNQPKKILADLTQMLIEKVFALQNREMLGRIASALVDGLNEKHMLLYMRHAETERLIDEVGWSGRVLDTPKDYLSVIHSNINGYKTDGVINERIEHKATIESDGSIVDTVKITRTHTGGDTPYEWWNKVNADYVRVYVPKGSVLLSSQGTTWEFPSPPLDYERLGFMEDADVKREESTQRVDEKTGIRVSEDAGKTVFGAWVYVSPKESVMITFQYRLPFSIDTSLLKKGEAQSYSMLFQKQSGSPGSELVSSLMYPENFEIIWQTEPNLVPYGREWRLETDLKKDVFQGVVFQGD